MGETCLFVLCKDGNKEIWARPLADGSVAVVLFSHSVSTPEIIEASFQLVRNAVFETFPMVFIKLN